MASEQDIDAALTRIGQGIIRDMTAVVAGTMLYAIHFVLMCIYTHGLWRKGWQNCTTFLHQAATTLLFLMASFTWADYFGVLVKRIEITLVYTARGTIEERLALANTEPVTESLRRVTEMIFVLMYLIGDFLIAWRVWVLYAKSTIVGVALFVLWVFVTGTGLGFIICIGKHSFALGYDLTSKSHTCESLGHSAWPLSLGLNLIATLLIIRIIWKRRNATANIKTWQKSQVDRILTILGMSGTLYMILGLVLLVAYSESGSNNKKVQALNEVAGLTTGIVVAMYPTVIFVLTMNERRIFGDVPTEHQNDLSISTIVFRNRAVRSLATHTTSGRGDTHSSRLTMGE